MSGGLKSETQHYQALFANLTPSNRLYQGPIWGETGAVRIHVKSQT
jgi:hypothetical protein